MALADFIGLIITPTADPAIGDIVARGASGGWTTIPVSGATPGAFLSIGEDGTPTWVSDTGWVAASINQESFSSGATATGVTAFCRQFGNVGQVKVIANLTDVANGVDPIWSFQVDSPFLLTAAVCGVSGPALQCVGAGSSDGEQNYCNLEAATKSAPAGQTFADVILSAIGLVG